MENSRASDPRMACPRVPFPPFLKGAPCTGQRPAGHSSFLQCLGSWPKAGANPNQRAPECPGGGHELQGSWLERKAAGEVHARGPQEDISMPTTGKAMGRVAWDGPLRGAGLTWRGAAGRGRRPGALGQVAGPPGVPLARSPLRPEAAGRYPLGPKGTRVQRYGVATPARALQREEVQGPFAGSEPRAPARRVRPS